MCAFAPSMQPGLSREERNADLWRDFQCRLRNCVADYNGVCRETVWVFSTSDEAPGTVRVALAKRPQQFVDVAADLRAGSLKCRYSRQSGRPQLQVRMVGQSTPQFFHDGRPIALDALSDLILMPLVPATP